MRRRDFLRSAAAAAAACSTRTRLVPVAGPQRGIGFDGYLARRASTQDFATIRALGASHVAFFPFGYVRGRRDPEVLRFGGAGTHWSLTDDGLLDAARLARNAGLRVILLPTLADFVDGHWRGEIEMEHERAWESWFGSYEEFLLHYAQLATRMHAVGLSVGTELRGTVRRVDQWRRLINRVRRRFDGWLTYAANWDDYDIVPWWDAVDLIGIQAYFELGVPPTGQDPRAALMAAWAPIRDRLAALSARWHRRILFTEIGYKSHSDATAHPWRWEVTGESDLDLQRAAYQAAFESCWREPWFAGFYWWKWRPDAARDADYERGFTPQGKPAEAVVRRYYLSARQ